MQPARKDASLAQASAGVQRLPSMTHLKARIACHFSCLLLHRP